MSVDSEINKREVEETDIKEIVEYDDVLSAAGELGRYQLFLFMATLPFYFFVVFTYFSQMFITVVSPNHWCRVPELENLTEIQRRDLAIPPDEKTRFGYSRCQVYDANWTEVLVTGLKPNSSWHTQPCLNGWEFNKTEIPYATISSEMGWVCEKDSYQATAQAIFFIGSVIGGYFIGWIADRYGRLSGIVVANVFGFVGGVASTFVRNFAEFATCRFLLGIASSNCMMLMYLLVLEYVAPKYRSFMANASFGIFYGVAAASLPWIVLACGHWQTISLVTSVPMALAVLTPLIVPESPRWLLSRGRVTDAIEKVLIIARINRKKVPPKLIECFKVSVANKKMEETSNILELFKRRLLAKMYICTCLVYMSCALVFDALVRSIGALNFDFFVSFSIISFTELPSLLIVAFIMDLIGRRVLVSVTMIAGCVFTILPVFVGAGLPSVVCAVIARFCINMGYGAAMQWAAELLPTPVRGTGASVIYIGGNVISILSPYIVYLEKYVYWLPLLIIGCVSGFGGFMALTLPETARKEMPQTFDDAEELVRKQKFWNFKCCVHKAENCHENNGFEM